MQEGGEEGRDGEGEGEGGGGGREVGISACKTQHQVSSTHIRGAEDGGRRSWRKQRIRGVAINNRKVKRAATDYHRHRTAAGPRRRAGHRCEVNEIHCRGCAGGCASGLTCTKKKQNHH